MTPEQVRLELARCREAVIQLAERYVAGERSMLYTDARATADTLACLADEAPESEQDKVLALLDRVEWLLRLVAH